MLLFVGWLFIMTELDYGHSVCQMHDAVFRQGGCLMQFNALRFMTTEIGLPEHMVELFEDAKSIAPTSHAIQKWYQREAIPGGYFAIILYLLERRNKAPVSMKKYVGRKV